MGQTRGVLVNFHGFFTKYTPPLLSTVPGVSKGSPSGRPVVFVKKIKNF